MFDIIIGLFGGLFYGGVLAKEKIENRIYNANRQEFEKKYREMSDAMTDHELMVKYRELVLSGDRREEIYSMLHEELTFAFGEDYRNVFVLPYGRRMTEQQKRDAYWARDLLLAKEGKSIGGSFLINYGRHEEDIRLCQCIEASLQKFLPEIELVVYDSILDKGMDTTRRYGIYLSFKHTSTGKFRRLW